MNIIYFAALILTVTEASSLWFNTSDITLPAATHGHFLAIYNEALIVGAGCCWFNESRSVSLPLTSNTWSLHPGPFPFPYEDPPVGVAGDVLSLRDYGDNSVQIGNKVYVINPFMTMINVPSNHAETPGGQQLLIYDLSSDQFSWGPTPLSRRYGSCTVYNPQNNVIYTIGGGWSGFTGSNNERFSISSNTWSQGAPLIIARGHSGCAYHNGTVYTFGGAQQGSMLNSIETYSTADNEMTQLTVATLTVARSKLICRYLDLNQYIYCMGGSHFDNDAWGMTDVDVFDPRTDAIIKYMHLNAIREDFDAIVWNANGVSCLIICGGHSASIEYLGDCTAPTNEPSTAPTPYPTPSPTGQPSQASTPPSSVPTSNPTVAPTIEPSMGPTNDPSTEPTTEPTHIPTTGPTLATVDPTGSPTTFITTGDESYETGSSNLNEASVWIFIVSFVWFLNVH